MTELFNQNQLEILTPSHLIELPSNLVVGFTTRNGGVSKKPFHSLNVGLHVQDDPSDVLVNRSCVADAVQFPLNRFVFIEQVHGGEIVKVDASHSGAGANEFSTAIKGFDGCYTFEKNILLSTCYADCVPLYFYTKNRDCVGLAHAGWKGTALEIGPKMIEKWTQEEGIPLDEIHVMIGPSIGSCCYEVDDYVIARMNEILPEETLKKTYHEKEKGKYSLDLKKVNMESLVHRGISPTHIHTSSFCTSCEPELFFSYRRDGGTTGRMMSYIGLREA